MARLAGNVASMTAAGTQNFSRSYTYDSLNRLGTMSDANISQACRGLSWTYDAWGNRTDQTLTAGACFTFHQTVNAQNQLFGSPYQYDGAGNLTADGSHTYTYDADNRLSKVDGGSTASYTYDAFGRRAEKIVGSRTTDYLYDAFGHASYEVNNLCAPVCIDTGFLYLGGQLVAEYKEGLTYFVHADHLGSTRLVTGLNQTVAQNLDYLPFGEQNSTDSGISTHEFTGDLHDAESDLDHAQFRQYSSSLGRWMHPDPAGLAAVDPSNPQSWNRYAYVLNNPMNSVDPSGLRECLAVGLGGCDVTSASSGGGGGYTDSGYCPPQFSYCGGGDGGGGVGVGIGISIGLGGDGGAGGGGPISNPRPVTARQMQLAQGFIGVDDAAEAGICFAQPEICIAVIGAIGVIELIRIIHMSQHGPGNVADTGIMNDAYNLIRAGAAATVCAALDILAKAAKAVGDSARLRKIRTTQKAWGCVPSRQSR